MSDQTDALKGALLSDADAYADEVAAEAVAAQKATDDAELEAAQAQVTALTDEVAQLQAELAALQDPPPDPPPPAPATVFGFNVIAGGSAYTLGASETAAQVNKRLVGDYGPFKVGKTFPNKVISSVTQTGWPAYPSVEELVICLGDWTPGLLAKSDAAILALAKTIPAGKVADLCFNEIDDHIDTTNAATWGAFVQDMNHLHDLIESNGLDTLGAAYCFTTYNATRFATVPTLMKGARAHFLVLDGYELDATKDLDGSALFGRMAAVAKAVGLPYGVGEHGDRRQEDSHTPADLIGQTKEISDAHRAGLVTTRMTTAAKQDPAPRFLCWFDQKGSSGDHRILTPPLGPDVLTQAAYKAFVTGSI